MFYKLFQKKANTETFFEKQKNGSFAIKITKTWLFFIEETYLCNKETIDGWDYMAKIITEGVYFNQPEDCQNAKMDSGEFSQILAFRNIFEAKEGWKLYQETLTVN